MKSVTASVLPKQYYEVSEHYFPSNFFADNTFEVLSSLALQRVFAIKDKNRKHNCKLCGLKDSFALFSSVPVALSHYLPCKAIYCS